MMLAALCLLVQSTAGEYRTVATFDVEIEHVAGWTIVEDGSFMARLTLDSPVKELSGIYRYDSRSRSLNRIRDGYWLDYQKDAGTGIASITDGSTLYHYDVKTGEPIAYELKQPSTSRFGDWSISTHGEQTRIANLRTGRSVRDDRTSRVVWTSTDRFYTVKRSELMQDDRTDTYFLMEERDSRDLRPLRSVRFGRSELADFRIIGDPTKPPFVIERSFVGVGVEAYTYDVVRQDFTCVGDGYRAVFGIQRNRFLTGIALEMPEDTYTRCSGIECRSLESGNVIWKRNLGVEVTGVEWVGSEIRASVEGWILVLNSGNGEVVRRYKSDERGTLPRTRAERPGWKLTWSGHENVLRLMRLSD